MIHQNLLKGFDLVILKSENDELDIDKLQKVPAGLSSFKSKVDKLDVDKLVLVPVNFSKQRDAVKMMSLKKLNIMNWLKTLTLFRRLRKYITTGKFNKLTAENFAARLKQAYLETKDEIDGFAEKLDSDDELKSLNKKVTPNNV